MFLFHHSSLVLLCRDYLQSANGMEYLNISITGTQKQLTSAGLHSSTMYFYPSVSSAPQTFNLSRSSFILPVVLSICLYSTHKQLTPQQVFNHPSCSFICLSLQHPQTVNLSRSSFFPPIVLPICLSRTHKHLTSAGLHSSIL